MENLSLYQIDPKKKVQLRSIITELIELNKGVKCLEEITKNYNIDINREELKIMYQDILEEFPNTKIEKDFLDEDFGFNIDKILYDNKDIDYEIIKYDSEYIIYAKINYIRIFILGFIKFNFSSKEENFCVIKDIYINSNFTDISLIEIVDIKDIIKFDIAKVLIKKAEKIAIDNDIENMITNLDNKYIKLLGYKYKNNYFYKNLNQPFNIKYFYIFLGIILSLKFINFYFKTIPPPAIDPS